MGQYYYVVNLDKKEYLEPYTFCDGAKLLEFGASGGGTMCALALLLANSNGRGGGDAKKNPIIGSWAGDRIVIAGDYAKKGDPCEDQEVIIYSRCSSGVYTDISGKMVEILKENL